MLPAFFRRLRQAFIAVVPLLALCLGGCASYNRMPTPVPLTHNRYDLAPLHPTRDKTLIVFLPGRGDTGGAFKGKKFIEMLAENAQQPTVAATVDLNFPYYLQHTAIQRLHEDIIAPARREGYRRIWLVGVSVGGMGALLYAHEHPGMVSGIVAIAPYLGDGDILSEIQAAGLDRWTPPPQAIKDGDIRRQVWLAIRAERYGQPGRLPLVLAYGTKDLFKDGQSMLGAMLPQERVFTTFGFHEWGTWRKLWKQILASPVSPVAAGTGRDGSPIRP